MTAKRTAIQKKKKAAPNAPHPLPLDLQMVIRMCYPSDIASFTAIFAEFGKADAAVVRALADLDRYIPNGGDFSSVASTLEDNRNDRRLARTAIADYFSAGKAGEPFTTPLDAADDVLHNLTYEVRTVALAVGVCLGYRLTKAAGGVR